VEITRFVGESIIGYKLVPSRIEMCIQSRCWTNAPWKAFDPEYLLMISGHTEWIKVNSESIVLCIPEVKDEVWAMEKEHEQKLSKAYKLNLDYIDANAKASAEIQEKMKEFLSKKNKWYQFWKRF
jgi:hypothetical protein